MSFKFSWGEKGVKRKAEKHGKNVIKTHFSGYYKLKKILMKKRIIFVGWRGGGGVRVIELHNLYPCYREQPPVKPIFFRIGKFFKISK